MYSFLICSTWGCISKIALTGVSLCSTRMTHHDNGVRCSSPKNSVFKIARLGTSYQKTGTASEIVMDKSTFSLCDVCLHWNDALSVFSADTEKSQMMTIFEAMHTRIYEGLVSWQSEEGLYTKDMFHANPRWSLRRALVIEHWNTWLSNVATLCRYPWIPYA